MPKKPNILLIFPDQHRADTMGCVGNPAAQTPNLDTLASQGVRFGRCISNSPLCMPARVSLIAGQYVSEHGVWNNNSNGDQKGQSHVRNIRDAGYHTAVVGKTHLYTHGRINTADHKDILQDWGYTDIHELTGPLASGRMNSPWTEFLEEKGLLTTWREMKPPVPCPASTSWMRILAGRRRSGYVSIGTISLSITRFASPDLTTLTILRLNTARGSSWKICHWVSLNPRATRCPLL